jgi:hypothetical protein
MAMAASRGTETVALARTRDERGVVGEPARAQHVGETGAGAAGHRVREQRLHLIEHDGHVVALRDAGHVWMAPLLQGSVRHLDLRLWRGALHAHQLVQVVVRCQ